MSCEPKICARCKWFDAENKWCRSPKMHAEMDMVSGVMVPIFRYCYAIRDIGRYDGHEMCGPAGIWFEPKEETP